MPTLVEKLQKDALDRKVPVSDLLRRVKMTATKLGLDAVEEWVNQELNGYETKPPSYRMVHGRPVGRNPIRGWMPIGGATSGISHTSNGQPVAALENFLANDREGQSLHVPYPDKLAAHLDATNGVKGWSWALDVPMSEVERILDRVRTLVLDWALALEKAGIMGSEIGFDEKDKAKAHTVSTVINIGSIGQFAGNLGQGNASGDVSITIDTKQLQSVIEQIKPHATELVAAGADANLPDKLRALEAKLKDSHQEHSATRGLVVDLRNALSGAAGSLLATGAISALSAILGG
jgi:hypothetical protein